MVKIPRESEQKRIDDYWLPSDQPLLPSPIQPEKSEFASSDFIEIYHMIQKNAKKLYTGGIKELKTVARKIAGRYLEHDRSAKSRIPFPNIPNVASAQHQRYEVDVKWDVHEIPIGGIASPQYLLVLYDKFKGISVYFIVIMTKNPPSVYEFWRNKDQKQYIFYPEPDFSYMFAITDEDREKLGARMFNDFLNWIIPLALSGKLALL